MVNAVVDMPDALGWDAQECADFPGAIGRDGDDHADFLAEPAPAFFCTMVGDCIEHEAAPAAVQLVPLHAERARAMHRGDDRHGCLGEDAQRLARAGDAGIPGDIAIGGDRALLVKRGNREAHPRELAQEVFAVDFHAERILSAHEHSQFHEAFSLVATATMTRKARSPLCSRTR